VTLKHFIRITKAVNAMADKIVVYSKQINEPRIPMTVRIDWFPDGTIKPCLYWTPDGSCYQIKHVYECTPLAFLKERGVGLRFKVRAEIKETPEDYSDFQFAQHEIYLYFADNWFCGKNIIDERYGHSGKEFIAVTLDVFPVGAYELVYFIVQGTRYMVEKTLAVEPRGSFYAGGVGLRHEVEARLINADNDDDPDPDKSVLRLAALYFEINKWFVSVKAAKNQV
jgi:hypothetical protein